MNWAQFKDPVSQMRLAGAMVASTRSGWVAGLSRFTVMTIFLSLNSANSEKIFRTNSLKNRIWWYKQNDDTRIELCREKV